MLGLGNEELCKVVSQMKPLWCQMWSNAAVVTDELNAVSLGSAHLGSAL